MPSHAVPERVARVEADRCQASSTDERRSYRRLTLTPTPLSALSPEEPLAVVTPRLRSLLLTAIFDGGTAYGAVNALRWRRPLWTDDPTVLSPVCVQVPTGTGEMRSRTRTLVVETAPNYAHRLRAIPVDDVPPTATTVSLDGKPAGVTRLLVRLVESRRLRVPVCSRTYRLLAGDAPDCPRERRTLCHLADGDRTFRVDRMTATTGPPPMAALVARALPTAGNAAFRVALPVIDTQTARQFWTCLQSPDRTMTARSLPDQIATLAGDYEYVLTPGGAYEFSVRRD
jgi:hypothetical protein